MEGVLFYFIISYLSGNILYACVWGRLIGHKDITEGTRDRNPGAANAFMQSGFLCGTLALLCDILKGFFPVWYFVRHTKYGGFALALIIAAPVLGHIFPLFHHFHGGKGISVSFGCLLGLYPSLAPALTLAGCFLAYSLVLVVSPHYHRTFITYLTASLLSFFTIKAAPVRLGFWLISGAVIGKLLSCDEKNEPCKVKLL